MIYLSCTSGTQSSKALLGLPNIGVMLTFGSRKPPIHLVQLAGMWAADNGCFTKPFAGPEASRKYLEWLKEFKDYRSLCLFAPGPDVVGDCAATWEASKDVLPLIRDAGFSAALVAQDGLDRAKMIDWDAFDVLFIGGTTEWKLSEGAYHLAADARRRDKWTHMGRVNSLTRLRAAYAAGFDSVDGTMVAFGPDINGPKLAAWMASLHRQYPLAST
jgi:hypothetical protein